MRSHELVVDFFEPDDVLVFLELPFLDTGGGLEADVVEEFPKKRVDRSGIEMGNRTEFFFHEPHFREAVVPAEIIQIGVLDDFLQMGLRRGERDGCQDEGFYPSDAVFGMSFLFQPFLRQSCPDDFVSVVGFDESGVVEQRSQEEVRQFFVVEFLGVSDFASPSKYVERVPDVVIGVVLYRLEYPQYVAVRFHQ